MRSVVAKLLSPLAFIFCVISTQPAIAENAKDADSRNNAAVLTVDIGDEISLLLPGESSLSQSFPVARDGTITLPEVGRVNVVNLTESALREKVKAQLSVALSTRHRPISKKIGICVKSV